MREVLCRRTHGMRWRAVWMHGELLWRWVGVHVGLPLVMVERGRLGGVNARRKGLVHGIERVLREVSESGL